VVIGGVITSTAFSMLLLPLILSWWKAAGRVHPGGY
jgi:Cu/Ag efflux pump CusA